MALFGKASAERYGNALDAMESCLSASHMDIQQPYKLRLKPFQDDILEVLAMFDAPETIYEHTRMMRLVIDMFNGEYFTGFEINSNQSLLERMRQRIRGKVLFTRSILQDKDANPKTARKNFDKFKLAEAEGVEQ